MLAMYLSISRCGDRWSLDRRFGLVDSGDAHWRNTLATRLIQLHLCVIYFFGGLGKARGWMWWDGTAMWFAAASFEYQSLDLTWIGRYPTLGSLAKIVSALGLGHGLFGPCWHCVVSWHDHIWFHDDRRKLRIYPDSLG
jgi:hypothetical protein